ncbi:MAG: hypothetical protein ACTSUN_00120 [Promethearchaeota archaeon]
MSLILSWIRKRFKKFKDSFGLIVKGLFICVLAFSGLSVAIILRILKYRGIYISLIGAFIQLLSMILLYLIFKKNLTSKEEKKEETRFK